MRTNAVVLGFAVLLNVAAAQSGNGHSRFSVWLSPGLDYGFSGQWRSLPGIKAGVEGGIGHHFYYDASGRASQNFEFFGVRENTVLCLLSGNALAGYRLRASEHLDFAVLGGVAYSHGTFLGKGTVVEKEFLGSKIQETEHEISDFSEIGIPVHLRALFAVNRIGASLSTYFNLQEHYNYGIQASFLIRLY